jgi:hypothetical protein
MTVSVADATTHSRGCGAEIRAPSMRRPRSVPVPELRDRLGEIEVLHHGPVSGHEVLAGLFSRAGVPHAAVAAEAGQHHLDHPDRFWDVVLGTGYRATVDALSPEQRDRVREEVLAGLRSRGITSLRTDVVFGTAERPE